MKNHDVWVLFIDDTIFNIYVDYSQATYSLRQKKIEFLGIFPEYKIKLVKKNLEYPRFQG